MWDQYVLKPQPWVYFINLIPYCLSKIDNWIKQFWDSSLEIQYENITPCCLKWKYQQYQKAHWDYSQIAHNANIYSILINYYKRCNKINCDPSLNSSSLRMWGLTQPHKTN